MQMARRAVHGLFVIGIVFFVMLCASRTLADPTDQQVNATRGFLEYALGFPFDAATVQSIRDGMTIDMSTDATGAQNTLADMDKVMRWVHAQPAASGALLRSLIEPALIANFQTDTSASSATSKALVAAWRRHNHIIAEGTPPLRKAVVDAYVSLFEFVAKQSGKPVPAEVANHSRFVARVASQYAAAPPDSQLKFNRVQSAWLALQTLWAQSTPAEKATLRQQWHAAATAGNQTPAPAANAAPSQPGFSGQISDEEKYKEKLFVKSEAQVWMSTWQNPF